MAIRHLTLKQRLLLTGLVLAVAPLLALGIVCWRQFNVVSETALRGSESLATSGLSQAGETAYAAVTGAQDDVLHALHVARGALNGSGGFQFIRHRHTKWLATNQETHAEKTVVLPVVSIGKLERRSSVQRKLLVDDVRDLTGATCTVFQRMNADGDMLRISTSVITADGKRAVGTYIPAHSADGKANPVVAAVLSGKQYRGKAVVVGTPYITVYEPITASDGSVIGMLYAGLPETIEANRLKARLSNMQATSHGEVFALSAAPANRGEYLFSTSKSGPTLTDGVMRRKLVDSALSDPNKPTIEHYKSGQGIPMVVHLRYFESWKWLLGIAIPEGDFLETARRIHVISDNSHRWLMGVFLSSIFISLLIWARYASALSNVLSTLARRSHDDGARILAWSKRLAAGSAQHASGIESQLATVEHSSSGIQSAARENEKRAQDALANSAASDRQVQETKEQLAGMQSSMQQLNAVNTKISGLMKTVDEIAFQSRILALNARIEAARAGEAGISFAVVAEQFGALAERCSDAAKSTTEFLTESSHSTRAGIEKLSALTVAIEQMGTSTSQIRTTLDEVHRTATEQVKSSGEVADALQMIKQVIQENDQMAQQRSQASHALHQLAGELHRNTKELSSVVAGRQGHEKPVSVAHTGARQQATKERAASSRDALESAAVLRASAKAERTAGPQLVPPRPGRVKRQRAQVISGAKASVNNRSARRAC